MGGALTVAKWEVLKAKGTMKKESLLILLVLLILLALFVVYAPAEQLEMDDKIYTIALAGKEHLSLVASDNRFDLVLTDQNEGFKLLEEGKVDLLILGDNAYLYDRDKSYAALNALKEASRSYRINLLSSKVESGEFEPYEAFPVWIKIHYLRREEGFRLPSVKPEKEGGEVESAPEETPDVGGDPSLTPIASEPVNDGKSSGGPAGLKGRLFENDRLTTPSDLTPPLPFRAILISFIFIFPLYFITQLYSSSIMEERVNRRGEFLLVAPVKRWELAGGKLLPYLLLSILIMTGTLIYLGEKPMDIIQILLILLPVVFFFLATFFVAGIVTRSFKELTFISLFFAAITSGYLFFPAVFMNIHAISSISPMTLVIRILEGATIGLDEYIFSTLPFYLTSSFLFGGGLLIFREEDLFTQKRVHEKILDIFDLFLRNERTGNVYLSILILSMFMIPFAYMMELISISLLFSIPLPYSVIGVILAGASVEELIKSTGVLTALKRRIVAVNLKNTIVLGVLSGLGFFIGEKLLLLATITSITGSIFGTSLFMTGKLLLPLFLHILTPVITALGIYRYGSRGFLPFLSVAIITHSLYNITIVWGYISG